MKYIKEYTHIYYIFTYVYAYTVFIYIKNICVNIYIVICLSDKQISLLATRRQIWLFNNAYDRSKYYLTYVHTSKQFLQ